MAALLGGKRVRLIEVIGGLLVITGEEFRERLALSPDHHVAIGCDVAEVHPAERLRQPARIGQKALG